MKGRRWQGRWVYYIILLYNIILYNKIILFLFAQMQINPDVEKAFLTPNGHSTSKLVNWSLSCLSLRIQGRNWSGS